MTLNKIVDCRDVNIDDYRAIIKKAEKIHIINASLLSR